MDIFDYIAANSPSKAMEVLNRYSRIIPRSENEISQGLRAVYKNLRIEEKEDFLYELSELHPDRELFMDTLPNSQPEYFSSACGCQGKAGANGQEVVNGYMSGDNAQNIMSAFTQEKLLKLEQNQNTKDILNEKLFKLITLAVIGLLAYKILK